MQEIITPRLSLRLMTEDFLEASFIGDAKKTESLIGLKISQDWLDENDLTIRRLEDYRTDAEFISWGLRAVGLKESNEMVGFIGFHTRPNPEYLQKYAEHAIEFGYTIFFQNRRRGFAEEAVLGLMNWAIEQYPLEKLATEGELYTYHHNGFWKCMDTLRDKIKLNELWDSNQAQWKIWK